MEQKQTTLKGSFCLEGVGLHTGAPCKATVMPAPEGYGYRFILTDTPDNTEIPALADHIAPNSERCTILERNGHKIMTMEHLLSALYGMGVDNARIELEGHEVPILDGSALPWVKAIQEAGIEEQEQAREYFVVDEEITYKHPTKNVEIKIVPADDFTVEVLAEYPSRMIGSQFARLSATDDYATQAAPCRTFVFLHELLQLHSHNLVRGGDWNNAIVFVDQVPPADEVAKLADVFKTEIKEVRPFSILNDKELLFNNEPARHKLMDLIGDLALSGRRIKGAVKAYCPGHESNVEMSRLIRKRIKDQRTNPPAPRVDFGATPVFDINQIRSILPHRPPFLLVDRVMEMTDERIVGIKNVTMNEPFFVGHFPEEPVMPGVLIIEALAQCGGVLVLGNKPDAAQYSTYFLKIDGVRFKKKVTPGDTLVFELVLTEPVKRGIVNMLGRVFVDKAMVCEATLMAQVIKNK